MYWYCSYAYYKILPSDSAFTSYQILHYTLLSIVNENKNIFISFYLIQVIVIGICSLWNSPLQQWQFPHNLFTDSAQRHWSVKLKIMHLPLHITQQEEYGSQNKDVCHGILQVLFNIGILKSYLRLFSSSL